MSLLPSFLPKWATTRNLLISLPTNLVFLFLDLLDALLCSVYIFLDDYLEGKKPSRCYCTEKGGGHGGDGGFEVSGTLFERENVFRKMGLFGFGKGSEGEVCGVGGDRKMKKNRWSDCNCEECVSWMKDDGELKLFHVVREPSQPRGASDGNISRDPIENVIFLHGFLCSSSYWTQTVFPNLSGPLKLNYRLFAVDLLGFGRSPKPEDCLYTLKDHVDMIENSVIKPYGLKSFHLVGHSMGSIISLAVAAKFPACTKSITVVAPPCIPCSKDDSNSTVLQKIAAKRLWPPLLFGSAFMSWYEHLGRCICLLVCRNHKLWERILKLLTWRRELHFMVVDFTRHTHHSAWHSMHNVICGGARRMDDFFKVLVEHDVEVWVVHGGHDVVVPLECISNIKKKVPNAHVSIVENAGHDTLVLGREKEFVEHLEHILTSSSVIRPTGRLIWARVLKSLIGVRLSQQASAAFTRFRTRDLV